MDAHAQVVVPPASEVPIPPKPESDSAKIRADTIQPAFSRMPAAKIAEIGSQLQWNREELFASGAFTVADLLERVPGATSFRTGWLASPKLVAVNGDFGRLRIFFDGLEIDDIDPRNGAVLDLNLVQVWTLEQVSVERFANELRVYLRSWQVDRTSPYTRTDVSTGDEDTNLYRGFYGKRFFNGAAVQAAAQQYSTTAARLGGGGDALSFMVRTGIARPSWSVDAFVNRTRQTRVLQPTFGEGLSLPDFDAQYNFAYLRAGIGTLGRG
ncbi:MAG: Plug domain-containing protein, partial [Gemmatimonadota bacterium]|nr:Plug domain-containing protein [Gemmatimonadota bacterium]